MNDEQLTNAMTDLTTAVERLTAKVGTGLPYFDSADLLNAIEAGVKSAFDLVYGEQILAAIADGTKEAMEG